MATTAKQIRLVPQQAILQNLHTVQEICIVFTESNCPIKEERGYLTAARHEAHKFMGRMRSVIALLQRGIETRITPCPPRPKGTPRSQTKDLVGVRVGDFILVFPDIPEIVDQVEVHSFQRNDGREVVR